MANGKLPDSIRHLNWEELNRLLLRCDDEEILLKWLTDLCYKNVAKTKLVRVYGRLAVVRRERELTEFLYKWKVAQEA